MKKMIVVGGGAAGMLAAIYASDNYEVTLIEKNEKLGKKLFITGKGRCNLTNNCDTETFLKNVVTNSKFMFSAINAYDCERTMRDFSDMGLKLKTERGNRVFPESDHSSDVIKVLSNKLNECGCRVLLNTTVTDVIYEDYELSEEEIAAREKYEKRILGVRTNKGTMQCDVLVIATGGMSYQLTGSTGDGYKFAERLGLCVEKPDSALVPVVIKESICKDLMGLSLKNVRARFTVLKCPEAGVKKDKVIYDDFGEMIFTHFGVSGPLILSASSYLNKYLRKGANAVLSLDLKPALDEKTLDERILRDFEKNINKQFRNSLDDLLPRKMIPVIVELSEIDQYKRVNEVTREERERLVGILKNLQLTVGGLRGFDEAIITSGGVSVKEINPKTMEAKKVKGLRFAGEVIDVDCLTGGFNLQTAFATGYLASM